MSKRNVQKGKEFERFLSRFYGDEAERTGFEVVETPIGPVQSGVDVRGSFWAAQAKKGPSFYPKRVREALDKASRDAGRRLPVVMAAQDGEAQEHLVIMRGSDFLRIQKLLAEYNIAHLLLVGANFGP